MSKHKCWNCKKREGTEPIYECKNEKEHWVCENCMEQIFSDEKSNFEVTPDKVVIGSMASTIRALNLQVAQLTEQLNDLRKKYEL